MKISLIAAMDRNHLIGANNQLPWHLPADLKHFKQLTLGKPILMGRKTYDSIGKPLPGRQNIVLTRDSNLTIDGCETVQSLDMAFQRVERCPEIMIIGGKTLYDIAMPFATHMYLTFIDETYEGDTYFPAWEPSDWLLVRQELHPSATGLQYEFTVYERLSDA